MNPPVPPPDQSLDLDKREKISLKLFAAYVLLVTALLTIALCALSAMTIRGIDDVIAHLSPAFGLDSETAEMLAAIFSQLDHAELSVHHEIPALLALVFTTVIGLILRAGKSVRKIHFAWFILIAAVVGVIFAVFSLGASIWMTDVNDIRFGDVVLSLSELLKSDIFSLL